MKNVNDYIIEKLKLSQTMKNLYWAADADFIFKTVDELEKGTKIEDTIIDKIKPYCKNNLISVYDVSKDDTKLHKKVLDYRKEQNLNDPHKEAKVYNDRGDNQLVLIIDWNNVKFTEIYISTYGSRQKNPPSYVLFIEQ